MIDDHWPGVTIVDPVTTKPTTLASHVYPIRVDPHSLVNHPRHTYTILIQFLPSAHLRTIQCYSKSCIHQNVAWNNVLNFLQSRPAGVPAPLKIHPPPLQLTAMANFKVLALFKISKSGWEVNWKMQESAEAKFLRRRYFSTSKMVHFALRHPFTMLLRKSDPRRSL